MISTLGSGFFLCATLRRDLNKASALEIIRSCWRHQDHCRRWSFQWIRGDWARFLRKFQFTNLSIAIAVPRCATMIHQPVGVFSWVSSKIRSETTKNLALRKEEISTDPLIQYKLEGYSSLWLVKLPLFASVFLANMRCFWIPQQSQNDSPPNDDEKDRLLPPFTECSSPQTSRKPPEITARSPHHSSNDNVHPQTKDTTEKISGKKDCNASSSSAFYNAAFLSSTLKWLLFQR